MPRISRPDDQPSKDGDIIARIAEKTGWHTVRGSSSRDGSKALREMIEYLKNSRFAGHVVEAREVPPASSKPEL